MATLAELLVKVGVDAVDVDRGVDRAERSIDSFASGLDNAGQRVTSTGLKLTAFATGPILALGNAATNAASDLNESMNAIGQVFGPAADKIEAFGETADQTVGLSQRAFNELVTPVGASLQNVGFSADEAADASINLAERAADMASVFNVDVSDALGAIQAGLRGEADPLERFGVGLSAAAVQAHAMELGLADAAGELDANALAQARLSLLMEQTDRIAGDFAATADQAANSERIMRAEAENAAAAFGQRLIPIKARLIGIASDLIGRFNSLSPAMQDTILKVGGLVAAIGPLLVVAGSMMRAVAGIITIGRTLISSLRIMITVFGAVGKAFLVLSRILLTNPFILVAVAIIALTIIVIKNWDKISSVIRTAWNFITTITSRTWRNITSFLGGIWRTITGAVRNGISTVVNFFAGLPGRAIRALGNLRSRIVTFFFNVLGGAVDGVKRGIEWLEDWIRWIPGAVVSWFGNAGSILWNAGRNIINGLIDGIQSSIGNLKGYLGDIGGWITSWKGPEDQDRKMMIPLGAAMIEGLMIGLADELPSLRRQLGDVGGQIESGINAMIAPRIAVPAGQSREILIRGDGTARADFVLEELRAAIQRRGGGDAQLVLGGRR